MKLQRKKREVFLYRKTVRVEAVSEVVSTSLLEIESRRTLVGMGK